MSEKKSRYKEEGGGGQGAQGEEVQAQAQN
jgi:hypothetical protein